MRWLNRRMARCGRHLDPDAAGIMLVVFYDIRYAKKLAFSQVLIKLSAASISKAGDFTPSKSGIFVYNSARYSGDGKIFY